MNDKYFAEVRKMGHYSTFKTNKQAVDFYFWYHVNMNSFLLTGNKCSRRMALHFYKKFMKQVQGAQS